MTYDPEANEAMQKPNAADASASEAGDNEGAAKPKAKKSGNKPNNVRKIRIERMMSKAELARRANLSVLTIDRVEKGFGCRMDTKRKILEALGLRLADRVRVFGEEE
jgi:DNA-binding XRE family transcriptional regulator